MISSLHSLPEEYKGKDDDYMQSKQDSDQASRDSTPPMEDFMLNEEGERLAGSPQQSTLSQNPKRSSLRQRSSTFSNHGRSKRIRTSFTPQQIAVLHAYFKTVMNPDGQQLEQIASATNLSKRVTQVWFQNARARKKKCGADSTQTQQMGSYTQPEENRKDFFSNTSLNAAIDLTAENESEVRTSSPVSSHISCSQENTPIRALLFNHEDLLN
ncbi:hypothetical protein Aperf_G00000068742 [Anoplocephala perfoliata]